MSVVKAFIELDLIPIERNGCSSSTSAVVHSEKGVRISTLSPNISFRTDMTVSSVDVIKSIASFLNSRLQALRSQQLRYNDTMQVKRLGSSKPVTSKQPCAIVPLKPNELRRPECIDTESSRTKKIARTTDST